VPFVDRRGSRQRNVGDAHVPDGHGLNRAYCILAGLPFASLPGILPDAWP
jgi:hypothetical protein